MQEIILKEKDYRTIKYFNPDNSPVLEKACPECNTTCEGYLSELEYPHEQNKVWFCCEGCPKNNGGDYEFFIPMKCTDVSVVCTYELTDQVEVVD